MGEMWVFLNTGPVSVVAHKDKEGVLLVRARKREHLEAALGDVDAEIFELPSADYRFRAEAPARDWSARLAQLTESIEYPNFKNSIRDPEVATVAHQVWSVIATAFGAYGR